jgi:ketosteroid isomerase-like protein
MSRENVELVQGIIDAFMRGDWAAALDGYDDDAELDQTRMPGGGTYRGRDGVRDFYADWVSSWDDFDAAPVELIEAGDDVIALIDITGTGRTSGAPVRMRAADVFTVAQGKVVRHVAYPNADEALAAMDLSE